MTAQSWSAVTLIIDHDLGFLMWLGEVLAELGYQSVPALHCRQALALSMRLTLPITAVVVNPDLRGARRLVKILLDAHPGVKVIVIRDPVAQPSGHRTDPSGIDPPGIQASSALERPAPWESVSRQEWVAKVRKALCRTSGR